MCTRGFVYLHVHMHTQNNILREMLIDINQYSFVSYNEFVYYLFVFIYWVSCILGKHNAPLKQF